MIQLQNHSAADIYPAMSGDEFAKLVEDIRNNGQRESIKIFGGKILDGRHRYKACCELDIDPITEDVDTQDPIAYVVSLNSIRRHLTTGQLAMCADRAREQYEKQAKERQIRKPADSVQENLPEQKTQARDAAGKAFGVSGKSVDMARKVRQHGDKKLIEDVEQGKVSLHKAVSSIRTVSDEELEERRKKLPESFQPTITDRKPARPLTEQERREGMVQTVNTASGAMQFVEFAILQLVRIEKDDPNRAVAFEYLRNWIRENE